MLRVTKLDIFIKIDSFPQYLISINHQKVFLTTKIIYACSFELNNQAMSLFQMAGQSFPAFSGLNASINQRSQICTPGSGPIPLGSYYIVDRKSGGRFGWLYDRIGGLDEWFALYAIDEKIDDETFCNKVMRGNFRLHPKAGRGISRGCITIERHSDFQKIRSMLLGTERQMIAGTDISTYGKVLVK